MQGHAGSAGGLKERRIIGFVGWPAIGHDGGSRIRLDYREQFDNVLSLSEIAREKTMASPPALWRAKAYDEAEAWEKKHGYPDDDDQPAELFNLVEDIGQRNNLAAEHPERVAELQKLLKQIREQGYSAPRLAK